MLISEIIDEVITEIGGDTTDTTLEANMLIFAKNALRRFPLYTRDRLLIDTAYSTLNTGENYLTTPTDFIKERSLYYMSGGVRQIIERLTAGEMNITRSTGTSGNPDYYRIYGTTIEFDKNAGSDVVIYIEYFKEVDDIEATDTFFGSTDLLEVMKDGMKAIYYSDYADDSDGKGDRKWALFKSGLDALDDKFMIEEQGGYIDEA